MAKIFLGIGHGGSDPGAVANGLKEADLNLAIGLACRDELVRHGVTVKMSRTKNEDDDLNEEVRECNAFNPDYAIDIHNNAGGGDGVELFHHYKGGKGKTLAQNILNEVVAIGQNSRGLKTRINSAGNADYYGFIRGNNVPARAIIIECAFIDNKKDIQIIDTAAEQKAFGVQIAKGILKTLGIKYKKEEKPMAKKDNTPDSYAKSAVEKAVKKGILKGTTEGDLKLHSAVTRQDLFVFLDRLGLLG